MDPWKVIVCQTTKCLYEALDAEGIIKKEHHLYPNLDNDLLTQFTCPKCGTSETWGITRRVAQKIIYERFIGNT